MYKKQLALQKILCMAAIIVCAAIFIYSLGIMTDIYDLIRGKNNIGVESDPYKTEVSGSWIYYEMQSFNKWFTVNSIAMLVFALLLFITGTHSRRRYYIGNFVSTGLFTIATAVFTVWSHINIESFKSQFKQMDFAALKTVSDKMKGFYTESTFWFDIHYVIFALLVIIAIALVVNVFLKLKLMKDEALLIKEGEAKA